MIMRKLASLAVLSLLAGAALATGEIYRWKDSSGNWIYSDQPRPGAEVVRSGRRPTPADNAPTVASTSTRASATSTTRAANGSPVSDEVARQVRQDAANTKADQCKKAEESYQRAIQSRRMYKTDAKGNRSFLSDAEIDSARLEARSNRDIACGPGT
jgi:hypothetical protein